MTDDEPRRVSTSSGTAVRRIEVRRIGPGTSNGRPIVRKSAGQPAAVPPRPRPPSVRARRDPLRRWFAGTLVLGLAVAGLQLLNLEPDADGAVKVRAGATKAAGDAVQTLISTSPETLEADLRAVARAGGPDLATTLPKDAARVLGGVVGGTVYLTGYADEVGLAALSGDHAEVLVAASGERVAVKSGKRRAVRYQARVSLTEEGGAWRVDRIRFVA